MGIMNAISKKLGILTLAIRLGAVCGGDAMAATLDDIRQSKTLRVAYREDAPPFAYNARPASPPGFMIELCQAAADKLGQQLKIPDLKVAYVPVTTANRLDAITQNKADLLCDSLTQTLERRTIVDFSIPTFIDGTSFAIRNDGPQDLKLLAGKKVGVAARHADRAGTAARRWPARTSMPRSCRSRPSRRRWSPWRKATSPPISPAARCWPA